MNTQYREDLKVWAISTESEHILHHKGSDDYTTIRKAITANPEDWEEIAIEDIPPYTNAQYAAKVSELIHTVSLIRPPSLMCLFITYATTSVLDS